MFKRPLIPTLIILAGSLLTPSLVAPPASAEELNIDGTKYWTLDIVAEKAQKYAEELKMCEGDRECEINLETAYAMAENEYSAGQAFMNNYFLISAINPAESTIRVIFHDGASEMMMPAESDQKDTIKDLYLFWWNGVPEHWIYAFYGEESNRRDIFAHIVEPGEIWLEPNQEVELKVPDFDFSILKSTQIFFYVKSEMGSAIGGRDFSECLNVIENLEGHECQAVFDWTGNISYQPLKARTKISASDIGVPAETTKDDGLNETTTERISTSIIRVPVAPNIASDATPSAVSGSTVSPISETVEVPLAAGKKEEHQFPWWLVVFIFSGIFLILWWLVPIRRKKDEEN